MEKYYVLQLMTQDKPEEKRLIGTKRIFRLKNLREWFNCKLVWVAAPKIRIATMLANLYSHPRKKKSSI